jgi:hypothetical protein
VLVPTIRRRFHAFKSGVTLCIVLGAALLPGNLNAPLPSPPSTCSPRSAPASPGTACSMRPRGVGRAVRRRRRHRVRRNLHHLYA